MSEQNGTTTGAQENVNPAEAPAGIKGKGKAIDPTSHDMSLDEDEDSSDEETGAEEEVRCCP